MLCLPPFAGIRPETPARGPGVLEAGVLFESLVNSDCSEDNYKPSVYIKPQRLQMRKFGMFCSSVNVNRTGYFFLLFPVPLVEVLSKHCFVTEFWSW